ncbi:MAG: nucleotidyltransferase domain-containing protein [Gammaproteobacteria bacterium]|nr:nucleotidyltransferase domain-containing protein [Gammaproteobacteria bacterium]
MEGVFRTYPEITAVYLFGSHAEGRARPDSDLDLALVGPREVLEARKLDILADLTRAGFDRIDLVLLEGADPALAFEAVRPNRLLYARPDFDHGSFYSLTLREYFDFEPYLRIQREALKRRLTGGQA